MPLPRRNHNSPHDIDPYRTLVVPASGMVHSTRQWVGDWTSRMRRSPAQTSTARQRDMAPATSGGAPRHRIRLVPRTYHRTVPSLRFDILTRDLREGDPPLWIGRFTQPSLHSDKLAFPSKVISRDHAEIWVEAGGKFYIRDTKSSSGTFLNDVRLSEENTASRPFRIRDGDVLQLGVTFPGANQDIYQCVKIKIEISGPISRPSATQESVQLAARRDPSDQPDNGHFTPTPKVRAPDDPFVPLPAQDLDEVVAQLLHAGVLSSKDTYKSLLEAKEAPAQRILDLLQNLLLSPRVVGDKVRGSIRTALLRLSASSGLYPQQLRLHDIEKESSPVSAGRFGDIWKGEHQGRPVCIKIFRLYQRSQIDHLLKICSREAIVWSQLMHPNLLPFYGIYHLGDAHGRVGLVAPWMGNGNLSEYLKAHPNSPRLPFAHDILAGLQYLHRQPVVHGDLKGVNILINADGSACLADFGLSSVIDADVLRWTSLTTVTTIGGTIRWMAPEITEATEETVLRPTLESDIYSLASVMYEVFTGKIPYYENAQEFTVLSKVTQGIKPSRPKYEAAPELTDSIWNMMIDCWSVAPGERPTIDQVTNGLFPQTIYTSGGQPAQVEPQSLGSPAGTLTRSDVTVLMNLLNNG